MECFVIFTVMKGMWLLRSGWQFREGTSGLLQNAKETTFQAKRLILAKILLFAQGPPGITALGGKKGFLGPKDNTVWLEH